MQQLSIRSFLAHDHPVELFTYGEVRFVPEGTIIRRAETVLPSHQIFSLQEDSRFQGSYAAFSDIFRYKLLLEQGGWWVDLDMICLKPFDFEDDWVFAAQRSRKSEWVTATCVIRAPAGSDLMAECYEAAVSHGQRETKWGAIGPTFFHAAILRSMLSKFIKPHNTFCPIDWWLADSIRRATPLPQNSHAIHLWHEVWRHSRWSTEPNYAAETLYQKLHKMFPPSCKA